MVKEQEGVVIEINGAMAKIKAGRHGDCKNCGACPGDKSMVLDAQNPIGAKPGQRVAFEIKETNMLKAAFIVYLLPIVAIFIGAAAGNWLAVKFQYSTQAFQITGGIIGFIISIIYIKLFEKSSNNNSRMQPVITRSLT